MKVIHKREEVVLHEYHFNDIPNDQAKTKVVETAIALIADTYGLQLYPQKVGELLYESNPLIRYVRVTEGPEVKKVIKMEEEMFAELLVEEMQKLPKAVYEEVGRRIALNMVLRNEGEERLKIV